MRQQQRNIDHARRLQDLPDDDLIGNAPGPKDDRHVMEMMRRLKEAMLEFKASSDRLAKRIVALNAILVVLTLVLVALTILLIVNASQATVPRH